MQEQVFQPLAWTPLAKAMKAQAQVFQPLAWTPLAKAMKAQAQAQVFQPLAWRPWARTISLTAYYLKFLVRIAFLGTIMPPGTAQVTRSGHKHLLTSLAE